MAELDYEISDGVGVITLNRPSKLNAINDDIIHGLARIYREAQNDDTVRALVLTGAGRAFCSGGDMKRDADIVEGWPPVQGEFPNPQSVRGRLSRTVHTIGFAAEALDKPLIAAVNGPAVGAGMDLALMCDIRFAARSATFSEAYIKVGLIPGEGGSYYLPRIVGMAAALELLLTGDFIDAQEALRIRLVNRVYDDAELLEQTVAFAARLAAAPPVHVQLIKRASYESAKSDLRTSLELTASHMAMTRGLNDSREALTAFLEKRPGKFTGS
jgi:enoyl-CoA hydratase/carnithine racemase